MLVAVAEDSDDVEALRRFAREHELRYPILLGRRDVLSAYAVSAFPTNYYLNADGTVTTPPLAVTLDAAYRFRLEGREAAEGRDCYVVAFEPLAARRALPRGRAWIDATGFAIVRTETVQTGLRGPIVSSRQRDAFTAVPIGDGEAWLPSRSEAHQAYEGPGHRTSIDRVLTLDRIEADPADFDARRAAAHASPSVIVPERAPTRTSRTGSRPSGTAWNKGSRPPTAMTPPLLASRRPPSNARIPWIGLGAPLSVR